MHAGARRARKQVPFRMFTQLWLRNSRQQRGRKAPEAPAAVDALRNNEGGPPNRSNLPDRRPTMGPGGNAPRNTGVGWFSRLLFLLLIVILAYQAWIWLGPNAN